MILDIKPVSGDIVRIDGKQVWPASVALAWKLTLPVDASGGKTGNAIEINPLKSDYQNPPWFVQDAGGMTFTAPADGATTSGSSYPRCELRELKADGSLAAWTVNGTHILRADCIINELPVKADGTPGRVVIGQIHGPSDELCRLYSDGSFYDDKATYGTGYKETRFVLKSASGSALVLPIGVKFAYEIKVADGNLTVSVVLGGVTYSAVDPISTFWPGKACYFKAGAYCQVGKPGSGAGTIGSGQASVTLSNVAVTHA